LVAVADGSEEIETVTIIDTLRRANIEVKVSKVGEDKTLECTMSRGVKLVKFINL
jgi:protein deglycase